jgi:hypothetical protein
VRLEHGQFRQVALARRLAPELRELILTGCSVLLDASRHEVLDFTCPQREDILEQDAMQVVRVLEKLSLLGVIQPQQLI